MVGSKQAAAPCRTPVKLGRRSLPRVVVDGYEAEPAAANRVCTGEKARTRVKELSEIGCRVHIPHRVRRVRGMPSLFTRHDRMQLLS